VTPADDRTAPPRTAVLVSRRRIDVGDVSRKGCRLETREPLSVGDVGMLAVDIEGQTHVELFRVSRSALIAGGEPRYEAGVEFLPMPAGTPSLQDVAAVLDESHSS
jgi:hypothetical protein